MAIPTERDRETARELLARAPEERPEAIAQALAAAREDGHRSWHARRIREGKRQKALRGGAAHHPRYGFRTVGTGKDAHFEVDMEEMGLVRLVREQRAAGKNSEAIAKAMTMQGYTNRVGGPLQRRQIQRILNQPVDPAELIARGEMLAVEKPPHGAKPPVRGYTAPLMVPATPVDAALSALRARYEGDAVLLAALAAKDAPSYWRARSAVIEAYGEERLVALQRELTKHIEAAKGLTG